MIVGKINVTQIDKDKLFKGEKGTYLDIVLIDTPDDQYGNDFMIIQGIPKEEREAGKKGNILGNAKEFGTRPASHDNNAQADTDQDLDDAEIPF